MSTKFHFECSLKQTTHPDIRTTIHDVLYGATIPHPPNHEFFSLEYNQLFADRHQLLQPQLTFGCDPNKHTLLIPSIKIKAPVTTITAFLDWVWPYLDIDHSSDSYMLGYFLSKKKSRPTLIYSGYTPILVNLNSNEPSWLPNSDEARSGQPIVVYQPRYNPYVIHWTEEDEEWNLPQLPPHPDKFIRWTPTPYIDQDLELEDIPIAEQIVKLMDLIVGLRAINQESPEEMNDTLDAIDEANHNLRKSLL